ncbi:shikimate kinase : Marine sediment metagenome DNA, contig: S03H2_L00797 OS=marine sediment metagenome GN=S03H2_11483 PE=3 SV=1: SKI [Gemmata massiliana]|uniref:Shikimate kinase n=1 Tax=Gemmata massiliana TaxID=1210884 RepID=A0A6P2CYG5_9BACT|nr:shikimate kinase [Gemmata massiliana]VTR93949.1 shikimate kinase : Marine sediment metagenome DNA, contig: S03H2_L00797 OS=marine sediment metagenome GN=S03H2_11483 PE=3 SV=1: SKI [Gemmata massiliana]
MSRNDTAQNIILVGYRCTGKTTVGRLLAEHLACPFADADDLVEASAGRSIKEIFATESETGFRDRESAALKELCAQSAGVISTGGGAILREANRALLKASGFVVWLTAAPETVWDRLRTDPTTAARRPNLTATGGEAEVRALIAARAPLYRDVAHFTVASDTLSPEGLVDAILRAWSARE